MVLTGPPAPRQIARRRALEATLAGGLPQPTYSEAVLAEGARLLKRLGELWRKALPDERAELAQTLLSEVRVRDQRIVATHVARDEYVPLIAAGTVHSVGMAPPDGLEPPTQALGRPRSIH